MIKSGKHYDKRRNCTFCAISSFVTMFSKSHLLQRRLKASIWGKGLTCIVLFDCSLSISFNTLSHLQKHSYTSAAMTFVNQLHEYTKNSGCTFIVNQFHEYTKTIGSYTVNQFHKYTENIGTLYRIIFHIKFY